MLWWLCPAAAFVKIKDTTENKTSKNTTAMKSKIKSYYFRHDFSAMDDDKIIALRMAKGWQGYGLFWALIECLAQNGGAIHETKLDEIAWRLRSEVDELKDLISGRFELFTISAEGMITNQRLTDFLQHDLNKRKQLSANAQQKENKSKTKAKEKQPQMKTPKTKEQAPLVFPFQTETFQKAWQRWREYRTEIRKPYKTQRSEQAALDQVAKYTEPFVLQLIERSIASGWQGLVFDQTDRAFEVFINGDKAGTPRSGGAKTDRGTFNGVTAN